MRNIEFNRALSRSITSNDSFQMTLYLAFIKADAANWAKLAKEYPGMAADVDHYKATGKTDIEDLRN